MSLRMKAAIAGIAGTVGIVYVLSIVPYLFSSDKPASVLPVFEIIIPALAFPLIILLVFVVPRRKDAQEAESKRVTRDEAEFKFRKRSLSSGAIAGFVAACILVGLILAGDAALGLPPGTFYSIIGIAMAGLDVPAATYFGVGLHLLTGTLVGATFGYLTTVIGPFNITSLARGAAVGVLAGFISFSILFIPVTRFAVEPSLIEVLSNIYPQEDQIGLQNKALDIMSAVLAGAILFHVIYGGIMGFITAALVLRPKLEVIKSNSGNFIRRFFK